MFALSGVSICQIDRILMISASSLNLLVIIDFIWDPTRRESDGKWLMVADTACVRRR